MNENNTTVEVNDTETCSEQENDYCSHLPKVKNDTASPVIVAISVFMLVFAVILAIAVTLIGGDFTASRPPSYTDESDIPSVIVPDGNESGNKITDNRERPTLPSHVNAKEDKTAYRPKDSENASAISFESGRSSDVALLVDLSSGEIVASKDADKVVQIASMTKVMTLIVACDYIENTEMLYASVELEYSDERLKGYNKAFVSDSITKETVYVVDLLYGLILFSGADCAYGLAEGFAGSEAAFVEKMNKKAKAIGMNDTNFTNCVGKDDGGKNVSTMRDTATMLTYALQNELCRNILSSSKWECVGRYKKPTSLWYLGAIPSTVHDTMKNFSNSSLKCGDVTVLGGKSGYENMSGYCLVSFAKNADGKEYVCVCAGNKDNAYNDTVAVYKAYAK